jgi:hypothetical protein
MQSNPSGRLLIHLSTGAEGRPRAWEISDWSQSGSDETTRTKPFSAGGTLSRKRTPVSITTNDEQWSSVMSAILTFIYREFCLARIAEIRRHPVVG